MITGSVVGPALTVSRSFGRLYEYTFVPTVPTAPAAPVSFAAASAFSVDELPAAAIKVRSFLLPTCPPARTRSQALGAQGFERCLLRVEAAACRAETAPRERSMLATFHSSAPQETPVHEPSRPRAIDHALCYLCSVNAKNGPARVVLSAFGRQHRSSQKFHFSGNHRGANATSALALVKRSRLLTSRSGYS